MKSIIFSLALIFFAFVGTSNTFAPTKKATIVIKTESIQCGMCKERIEKAVSETNGVKSVSVDVDKKETTVVFNPKKTNADTIKKAIAAVGYDADDLKGETTAYGKLPSCCQKGGH
jgi:copper chaperone CopZ